MRSTQINSDLDAFIATYEAVVILNDFICVARNFSVLSAGWTRIYRRDALLTIV